MLKIKLSYELLIILSILMRRNEDFVTEVKMESTKNDHLQTYVDSLGKRIDSAKWKQNLVLMYNYMPLTIIQDKMTAKLSK